MARKSCSVAVCSGVGLSSAAHGLAMTVTANLMISAGRGPWAALDSPTPLQTATLQLFLAIAILGAWFLTIGIAERDIARSATTAERAPASACTPCRW